MKFIKRITSAVIAVVTAITLCSGHLFSKAELLAEALSYSDMEEYGDICYLSVDEDDDGTYDYISIRIGDASASEIDIPSEINGLPVKDINAGCFIQCGQLTNITVPYNITSIGDAAFASCSNLKSITIENPECEIYDSSRTICNMTDWDAFYSGGWDVSYFDGIIYGYEDSTAQDYAKYYGYSFESLGDAPEITTPAVTTTVTTTTTTTTTATTTTTTTATKQTVTILTVVNSPIKEIEDVQLVAENQNYTYQDTEYNLDDILAEIKYKLTSDCCYVYCYADGTTKEEKCGEYIDYEYSTETVSNWSLTFEYTPAEYYELYGYNNEDIEVDAEYRYYTSNYSKCGTIPINISGPEETTVVTTMVSSETTETRLSTVTDISGVTTAGVTTPVLTTRVSETEIDKNTETTVSKVTDVSEVTTAGVTTPILTTVTSIITVTTTTTEKYLSGVVTGANTTYYKSVYDLDVIAENQNYTYQDTEYNFDYILLDITYKVIHEYDNIYYYSDGTYDTERHSYQEYEYETIEADPYLTFEYTPAEYYEMYGFDNEDIYVDAPYECYIWGFGMNEGYSYYGEIPIYISGPEETTVVTTKASSDTTKTTVSTTAPIKTTTFIETSITEITTEKYLLSVMTGVAICDYNVIDEVQVVAENQNYTYEDTEYNLDDILLEIKYIAVHEYYNEYRYSDGTIERERHSYEEYGYDTRTAAGCLTFEYTPAEYYQMHGYDNSDIEVDAYYEYYLTEYASSTGEYYEYFNYGQLPIYISGPRETLNIGDINEDGRINIDDAKLLQEHFKEGTIIDLKAADMNGDGRITSSDLVDLCQQIADNEGQEFNDVYNEVVVTTTTTTTSENTTSDNTATTTTTTTSTSESTTSDDTVTTTTTTISEKNTTATTTTETNTTEPAVIVGDINGDDEITIDDAKLLQEHLKEGTIIDLKAADMNGDGKINSSDLVDICQDIANITGQEFDDVYNEVSTTTSTEKNDGDANGDKKLNVRDAAFIASKIAQGLTDELPDNADFNNDNKINIRDAAAIAKYLAG